MPRVTVNTVMTIACHLFTFILSVDLFHFPWSTDGTCWTGLYRMKVMRGLWGKATETCNGRVQPDCIQTPRPYRPVNTASRL